jgi:hypothetical protein
MVRKPVASAPRLAFLTTLLALVMLGATQAQAQQQGPDTARAANLGVEDESDFEQTEWRYQNAIIARINPLGLINQFQIGFRYNLTDSESLLRKGTYLYAAFAPQVSPAFARAGWLLEAQPLSILRLSALYETAYNFGTFDTIQSFPSPLAEHSDRLMDEQSAEASYATGGHVMTLSALLQLKGGPIAARANYRAIWQTLNLRGDDTVFYDLQMDILAPNGGWLHTVDTDLLYVTGGPITAGLRHTVVSAAYPDSSFITGETREGIGSPTHRAGPIFIYRFNEREHTRFNQPTLFVIANWWLEHRYRTGQEISQALPYAIVGFAFNGNP